MNKMMISWHGKDYYFLGTDEQGTKLFLTEASFDCGWYWGLGYIRAFTNNKNPQLSKDIKLHTHWDSLFNEMAEKHGLRNIDAFDAIFHNSPFTTDEKWKIMEIMESLYTARKYSDMLSRGGANYTHNPCAETIMNGKEYDRINKVVIPELLKALYGILFMP